MAHLAAQRITGEMRGEVILVDNGSTDDTAQRAMACWPPACPIPLHIVYEPRLGLSYARERGLSEARYELVSFVDDDNWVSPQWVETAAKVMSEHPRAGACGGFAREVCEVDPPWWFEAFKTRFAVGPDRTQPADVTELPSGLWGAGLTIRKSAWLEVRRRGFDFLLPGRQGAELTEGEDTELCYALRLAGWRLQFDPRLKMHHFLPKERVQWSHLRARHRAGGISSVGLDPYRFAWRYARQPAWMRRWGRARANWKWQAGRELVWLVARWPLGVLLWPLRGVEGRESVLGAEYSVARLKKLCQMRAEYDLSLRQIDLQWAPPPERAA
jgi:glycosyltransferase involved in cell wall biosynthesis